MSSRGPFSPEEIECMSRKVEWSLKKAERTLPSGMLANIGFKHLSLGALATRDLWDLLEEVKGYQGMTAKVTGIFGTCVFLCSRAGMNLLSSAFREELETPNGKGLTSVGQDTLGSLAQQISGSFLSGLSDSSGVPLTLAEGFVPRDPSEIIRPLAAMDTAMLKGFVMEDRVGLTLHTLSGELEGQALSIFAPVNGDVSAIVNGIQSSRDKKPSPSARVLVVDDAPFMRAMIKKFLANTTFDVIGEASTGAEALEAFKKIRPDVVVMDIMMPDMGGVAAVRAIQEVDSSAKILMCSALASKSMVNDALAQGAKGYVVKPFKAPDILAALDEVMNA